MSPPTETQSVPLYSYIRTCPESARLPLLYGAPIAIRVPSDDKDTDDPLKSSAALPSMSLPN
jgi:hypothetical protein